MFNLDFLPIVNLLGFVVLVATTIYQNKKSGKDNVTSEVLDLYQKQIAALKEEIVLARAQLQELTLKIGNLEGQLKEKDKKLTDYLTIFQNRNPELQTYMQNSEKIMIEIHAFMKQLNNKAIVVQVRNQGIDRATKTDSGHLLRKK